MSSTCTSERQAKEAPPPPLPPKGVTGKVLGWQSKGSEDVPNELHEGNRVLPCESLGRKGGDGRVMKDEAHWVAVTGKRGEPGMRPIKGICTTFSQNRMILLQGIVTGAPWQKNGKSEQRSCLKGSKECAELAHRCLSWSIPKKDTKLIAQKEASKLECGLSFEIRRRMPGVIGCFWAGTHPLI